MVGISGPAIKEMPEIGYLSKIRAAANGCRGAKSWMEFHRSVQTALVELGEAEGYWAESEFKVYVPSLRTGVGRVDVYWRARRQDQSDVAIEIDSSVKEKSLAKLLHLTSKAAVVWLNYAPRYPEIVGKLDPSGKVQILRMPPETCVQGKQYTGHHSFLLNKPWRSRQG